MDNLIQELNQLRINRDEASRKYQRTLDESSRRECNLLAKIQQQQQQQRDTQFHKNIRNNRLNRIRRGDTVRITNDYKPEESGIVGKVTHVTRRMVELQCAETGKPCTRAWWNVGQVVQGTCTK